MTGRELAMKLLALPNPDLPVELEDGEGRRLMENDAEPVEDDSEAYYAEDYEIGKVFRGYKNFGKPDQEEIWSDGMVEKKNIPKRRVILI